MPNFSSYILYLLLLTVCYSAFGFTLDIKISTCYLTFTLLSLTSYALYLLLLTIHQFAFGFTLDIKLRKIIQSSVLSFLGVLKVVNFLLPSLSQFSLYCWVENLLSGYSPPIMQSSSACSLVVHKCIAWHWGMLRECTLGSYRVLHSISINITKILAVLYKLMPLLSVSKLVTSAL